ncbi:MAG: hypothetical protein JNL97_11345 [Verrucomicrobiales bacterium]|nr:hypothetical protein [Verrucomicrobiales bacterium]
MNMSFRMLGRRAVSPLALLCTSIVLSVGCGKKAEEEVAATPPPAAESAAPAEEQASTTQEESTTEDALAPMNVDETLRGSDNAVAAKDWGGATDALLKLQMSGSIKNDQQSWDYNKRMTALQQRLVEAADNGDPKAQAAIDLLKRSRRVR